MKINTKIRLANLTTWIMLITISIIAIWFIGFVVSNTFDLNVFTQKASTFIYSFIGFSSVLVVCSAILNISINISIIADSKISNAVSSNFKTINKKLYFTILIVISGLIAFLFLGDYLTRKNVKDKLVDSSDYIVKTYSESINKIGPCLIDTAKVAKVPEVLKFLSEQKSEFPKVILISSGKYDGQLTFLEIDHFTSGKTLKEPLFGNSFYKCEDYDCQYLTDFFTGKTKEKFFWTEESDYKLYYPFEMNGVKFILLFTKFQRDGKIGSY